MKDYHSFEDIIRDKTERANYIPSDKVWNELNQIGLPRSSPSEKSFRMKAILFSVVGIILFSAIFYNYLINPRGFSLPENRQGNYQSLNTLDKIKEKARREDKFILIKVVMEGCTFCGKMERETFLTEEVQNTVNESFIILDIDIKDPNYRSFLKRNDVNAAPVSLFLDKEGTVLVKVNGFRKKDIYLHTIQGILDGTYENNIPENTPLNHPETVKKQINSKEKIKDKSILVNAYPNPSNGRFNLDIKGNEGDALIYFLDFNGQLLLKEKINDIIHKKTLEYDFSNRDKGIIIKVEQGKKFATEKIIIQR